jgi:hypothetical protein
MGTTTPRIDVCNEELFSDEIGQRWSPASVQITWPATDSLPVPSIQVKVIALAHGDMGREKLEKAHLQAAQDVLTAALLTIEQTLEAPKPLPSLWRHLSPSRE